MARKKRVYRDPRPPQPVGQVGRYDGNSPTYRRNQTGDYSSNADRYEKAIELVPRTVDQNNPWLFASGEADDGYWRVYLLKATCRDLCGGCTGESGKIIIYPGERPLKAFIALGPGLPLRVTKPYIEVHRWSQVPQQPSDIQSYRFWYADIPYNSTVLLEPGIYSFSTGNPFNNSWDTVCVGFGQIALGIVTIELLSYV